MKIKHMLILAVALIGLSLAVPAIAQAITPAPLPANSSDLVAHDPVVPVEVTNVVLGILVKLAATHPWIATLISIMGLARVWAKPVMSLAHNFIELSPSKRDDDLLASVLVFFNQNPIGRVLAYLLDWFASIKIQVPAKPDQGKPIES